jgi:hypothetical protein
MLGKQKFKKIVQHIVALEAEIHNLRIQHSPVLQPFVYPKPKAYYAAQTSSPERVYAS